MFESKITTRSGWGQMTSINSSCAPGFVPIPCPSHLQYSITNICKAANCIQPLCPECIADHVQLHQQSKKPAKIQNIITTRVTCIEQLAKMKYQAQKQIDQSIINSTGNIEQFIQSHQKKLDIAYKKVIKIVQQLFTSMNKQMQVISNAYSLEKQKRQKQAKMKLSPISDFILRISEYKQQLQSNDYIPALIELLNQPPRKPKYEPPTEIQKFGSVEINEKYLQDIKEDITKFVKVVVNCKDQGFKNRVQLNKSSFNGSNNMKFSRLQRSKDKNERDGSQSKFGNDSRRSNSKKKIFGCESVISDVRPSVSSSRIQFTNNNSIYQNLQTNKYPTKPIQPQVKYSSSLSPIIIHKSSYFSNKNSSLWYFKQNTKNAFKAPIQSIEAGFEKVQLNINFFIPQNHKICILPNGTVFLIGGQNNQITTNKTYILQEYNMTFKQIAPMFSARSLFGICYYQQCIYVAGGLRTLQNSNKKPINQVEIYNIRQQKWQKVISLPEPSYNFSMHALNSGKILKFGGITESRIFLHKIDILEINQNRWISVQIDSKFMLMCNPGLTKISNQSLVIFGGRQPSTNQQTSKCYILTQQQKTNSYIISQGPQLYNESTFQSTYIHDGMILTIQNNEIPNRNKLIMGYKYDQWKFISC